MYIYIYIIFIYIYVYKDGCLQWTGISPYKGVRGWKRTAKREGFPAQIKKLGSSAAISPFLFLTDEKLLSIYRRKLGEHNSVMPKRAEGCVSDETLDSGRLNSRRLSVLGWCFVLDHSQSYCEERGKL